MSGTIYINPAVRVKKEMFWGKMWKITGISGIKRVLSLQLYRPLFMTWIENSRGNYVGDEEFGLYLYKKGIIDPETAPPLPGKEDCSSRVCSIGWCEREQKWYGWSHRAMCGFEVGAIVHAGDCTASPGVTEECLKEHPDWDISLPVGFEAKTIDDAYKMACAFAESVS